MEDCLFCKIINGEIPSYKIYEDEHTYAFLDISNDCLGHTLVVPKQHSDNILKIKSEDLIHTMNTTKLLCEHYNSLGFTGFNIQNNCGESAGQSVFHLHIHILPRNISKNSLAKLNLSTKNNDLKTISEVFLKKVDTP